MIFLLLSNPFPMLLSEKFMIFSLQWKKVNLNCSFDWIFFCYCWKVLISRFFINPLIERVSHHTAQWKSNLKSSWERSIFQLIWKFYVCHVFDWIFFEVFVRLIRTYQQLVNELKFSSNYFPLWSRF